VTNIFYHWQSFCTSVSKKNRLITAPSGVYCCPYHFCNQTLGHTEY